MTATADEILELYDNVRIASKAIRRYRILARTVGVIELHSVGDNDLVEILDWLDYLTSYLMGLYFQHDPQEPEPKDPG